MVRLILQLFMTGIDRKADVVFFCAFSVGHPALVTESCLNSALSKEDDSAADRAAAHKSCVTKCGQEKLDAMLKRRYDMAVQRFEDEKAGRDLQMEECPICMVSFFS